MVFLRNFLIFTLLTALLGCSGRDQTPEGNAAYYWRSTFALSDVEKNFLKDNDIKVLYVKFYDVVAENQRLRPEATLLFKDRFPADMEIVPTVFIDSKAFDKAEMPMDFADMLVARVDSMMSKNGYAISKEIQLDFDWTTSNREKYFTLLKEIRHILNEQDRRLSTTVRLHQLRQPAPPADYGALMVYNTGSFSSPKEQNSILNTGSVMPYIDNLKGYRLPLVAAFPIYSWNLIFHDNKFMVIARDVEYKDTTLFEKNGSNTYRALRYMPVPHSSSGAQQGARILPGDILRHEWVPYSVIDSVESMIGEARPEILKRVIIYHVDENSIKSYNKDELKKIYNRR